MVLSSLSKTSSLSVTPVPITVGDQITITYNGFLAKNNPREIYLHYGYGSNDNWRDVKDIKMHKTPHGWEATLKVTDNSRLNFCFKDNENCWDNNYGQNWNYEIHNGTKIF